MEEFYALNVFKREEGVINRLYYNQAFRKDEKAKFIEDFQEEFCLLFMEQKDYTLERLFSSEMEEFKEKIKQLEVYYSIFLTGQQKIDALFNNEIINFTLPVVSKSGYIMQFIKMPDVNI